MLDPEWDGQERRYNGNFERRAQTWMQTIMSGLMLAGIIGGLSKFSEIADKFGALQVHLAQIDERIIVLQAQIAENFRLESAKRTSAGDDLEDKINDTNRRVRIMENTKRAATVKELQDWQRN